MRNLLIAAAAAAVLAACGGGDGGSASPPPVPVTPGNEVPAAATQDPAAAQAFVASVAGAPDETGEPFGVGTAPLATSETDEPKPL